MTVRLSAATALWMAAALAPAAQPTEADHAARIASVERALVPSFAIENEPREPVGLVERMEELGVPGVSVAFFEDGEVVWTRAYGLADVEGDVSVTPETRFQAASISKPVAATAALDLVEEGRLRLDADVNEALTSWQVPSNVFTAQTPVTLRGLLTHTAGLTVHGFPGYGPEAEVPSTAGVLDGAGNTDAVRVDMPPRTEQRYSGGGYTVMQQLVMDATGQPFAEVLADRVLGPLGMTRSTFAQPLPEALRSEAAHGYRGDGALVDGGFHTYPEQAAAGLWTTPTDLARWAIAIQATLGDGQHPVLEGETVRQMVTPDSVGGYGLGPGLHPNGAFFGHGGANEGFRCVLTAQLDGRQGVAIMTNSDRGGVLMNEILFAVAREYGWSGHEPRTKRAVPMSDEALAAFAGRYRNAERGLEVEIAVEDGALVATTVWDGEQIRLAAEDPTTFFDRQDGTEIDFAASGEAFTVQGLRFERAED